MAAPSLFDILTAIEARLATIPGLWLAPEIPDQVNVPAAVIGVPDIPDYRLTFRSGRARVSPTVTVLTSAAFDRDGQMRLASYADFTGTHSIKTAIEGDRTLGGVVEDCYVADFRVLGLEEVGQIGYYGGIFTLPTVVRGA